MESFWNGFEKRGFSLPEYNLRNAMLAGIPLGAAMGIGSQMYYDRHPEKREMIDKALLSKKRTGIPSPIMGAAMGSAIMGGRYLLSGAGK